MEFPILETAAKLGIRIIKDAGAGEIQAVCPFCEDGREDGRGHLYMNTRENVFICHKCGVKGNTVVLVADMYGVTTKEAYVALINNVQAGIIRPGLAIKSEEPKIASLKVRDAVYNALLDSLKLKKPHLQNLIKRGLAWENIAVNKYKSLPDRESEAIEIAADIARQYSLDGIPGFYKKDGKWTFRIQKGFLIPVRDADGLIQGLQVRCDDGDPKYVWFSSRGKPYGTPAKSFIHVAGIMGKKVYITEGPLKADIAHHFSNQCFVALAGVNAQNGVVSLLKSSGVEEAAIAFDMDKIVNPEVLKAEQKLKASLEESGIKVVVGKWDSKFKGIDDWLLYQNKKKVKKII